MIDPATECAIRQLHARYIDAVWRKDAADFAACWTGDARWRIAGIDAQGREAVAAAFVALIAPSQAVAMIPGALVLDRAGDGVAGRLLVTELIVRPGARMRTLGRYYDLYAREEGCWRFARRDWHAAYRGSPDLSEPMLPREDCGPPPAMPAS